jgi:hypothetical protein
LELPREYKIPQRSAPRPFALQLFSRKAFSTPPENSTITL